MYGLKPVPFKLKPVPFKGRDTQDYFNKLLEQFSNSCALFSCVQGGSFLRKRPLIIVLSVYSNWRTARASQQVSSGVELLGERIEFVESAFEVVEFLPGLREFAFRCEVLVVGEVAAGLCDEGLKVSGLRWRGG